MGGIISSVSNYVDVWKMDTFAEIDYQDDMRRQFETMRSFGRQEALTQSVRAGAFGGGASPLSAKFGNTANFWFGVNNWLLDAALPSLALALILAAVGFLASQVFIFWAGVWLFVFSLTNFVSLNQTQAAKYSYKSRYFFTSMGMSIFAATAIALATPLN